MKPRNFPGRKHARRVFAAGLQPRVPHWRGRQMGARAHACPTVADQVIRCGAANRDAETGQGRTILQGGSK